MSKVLAIAVNTFKEAVRNRVLYVLLFFSVLILIGAWVASTLSIERPERIVRDLGAAAINVISGLIAVFVGIGLVYNDLDKKTIYTVVSKPISRWQFLVGKYLGLMLTIAVNVAIMTFVFCVVLYMRDGLSEDALNKNIYKSLGPGEGYEYLGAGAHLLYLAKTLVISVGKGALSVVSLGFWSQEITQGLVAASLLTLMEMAIVVSFAVLFSSFSTPTLSAFLTAIVWVIGKGNEDLWLLVQNVLRKTGGDPSQLAGSDVFVYWFAQFCAHVAPNLELFNKRPAIAEFKPVTIDAYALAYGAVYSTMVILLAITIFRSRNFK